MTGSRWSAVAAVFVAFASMPKGLRALDEIPIAPDEDRLREEIVRLGSIPSAAASLDLDRMRRMIDAWPSGGWHTKPIEVDFCLALLRGVVSGQFLRKASRSNA
jgi:asparagine synthase (glutamine-hydrolysing)